MKTLVIHPQDNSTKELSIIYENHLDDWTIINNWDIPKSILRERIKEHDRIIMMGHGTPGGLLNPVHRGFIIDSSFVDLLREKKECVHIWCNSDKFVKKYNLKGFTTGMIISEEYEADYCGVSYTDGDVVSSNVLFSESIRDTIDETSELMVENTIRDYNTDDNSDVLNYNRSRIYLF